MAPQASDRSRNSWQGRRALITGVTGQDGYYLALTLLEKGCHVLGGVRREEWKVAQSLAAEIQGLELVHCDLEEQRSVEAMIERHQPEVVYHLAAQSSVGLSWKDPVGTAQVNAMGTLHLLEALRRSVPEARFVMAGSCDCYDHEAAGERGVTVQTPFKATNPYAATKILAHQMSVCYREQFGLRAAVAVFFNHTSPRRHEMFVERGLVRSAVRVARGLAEHVAIGSLDTRRDWSWAPEIMEGFAALGMLREPLDLVLASGRTRTTGDWVREAFRQLGLEEQHHIRIDAGRLHAGDRPHTHGNIEAARKHLKWTPRVDLEKMVRRLIQADLAELEKTGKL
jgi:GDPmannose 4,6-dehydratase